MNAQIDTSKPPAVIGKIKTTVAKIRRPKMTEKRLRSLKVKWGGIGAAVASAIWVIVVMAK